MQSLYGICKRTAFCQQPSSFCCFEKLIWQGQDSGRKLRLRTQSGRCQGFWAPVWGNAFLFQALLWWPLIYLQKGEEDFLQAVPYSSRQHQLGYGPPSHSAIQKKNEKFDLWIQVFLGILVFFNMNNHSCLSRRYIQDKVTVKFTV